MNCRPASLLEACVYHPVYLDITTTDERRLTQVRHISSYHPHLRHCACAVTTSHFHSHADLTARNLAEGERLLFSNQDQGRSAC